ncbi:MAG: DUF3034 family protein [Chloroflexales bacterium]
MALADLLVALNDYSSSRYYDLQPESAQPVNHPIAQNHAARTESPHTPFADRFTGGATTNFHAGHPDRSSGSSLKNSAYDIMKLITKHSSAHQHPAVRLGGLLTALIVAAAPLMSAADDGTNAASAKTEKPPPLPLHQIEGNGGIFSTLSAYLVNPPRDGEPVGRPAVGFSFVDLGYGRELYALTATETPWKRLELGFGYENFNLGDLPQDILHQTGLNVSDQTVSLYNANARIQILKETEFDQKWIPALTFGTHFKYNDTIHNVDNDLQGTLSSVGIRHNSGVDYTLYASKLLTFLPRPVLIELGGRATKGVWTGLAGFTEDYSYLFEGNIGVFITDNLILAAEYRQMPNNYKPIVVNGETLVGKSSDWWTIDAAYIINRHWTVAVGYGHFGQVLNHQANGTWGITTKYEF